MRPFDPADPSTTLDFLSGGGVMGELMRSHDWRTSVLGDPTDWPQSLRSVVGLLLNSRFPMFVAWGAELGVVYNDAYAQILGAKHPQSLGARFQNIWAEIWSDISPLVDAALAGEASYRRDLPLLMRRNGDDEQTWFTFSYSPVRDESGRVAGMFCACTESTSEILAVRRRDVLLDLDQRLGEVSTPTELAFAASELLGEALGAVRVGYGMMNPAAGTITVERDWAASGFASAAGVHSFDDYGSYIDELREGQAVACADANTDPRTSGSRAAFAALGVRAFLDIPVVEQGRTTAQLFVHSATPRRWTDEEIAFVRAFAERTRAAIARRTAEQGLHVSEALSRMRADELIAIYDAAPVGLCVFDREMRFVRINDRLAEINGRPAADHIGRTVREIVPDLDEQALQAMQRVLQGEALHNVEFAGTTPAQPGVLRTWRESWLPLRDAAGEVVGITVSAEEITEAKRAEQALHELNATLETRIAQAILEREQVEAALRQAQKMEAMGQLTGGVAHDFNNLLTPIVGSLDMLQRKGLGDDRERRLIDGALQSAERAKLLVQRLLAFARRQPLQPKPVDVSALIGGMADLIASTSGPKTEVIVDIAADVPAAVADANQLEMAILNLAVNARDAMIDGGRLTIAARADAADAANRVGLAPGHYVRLSVADTGVGMDAETARCAVEPFYSTKGIGRGTGLGLSMVHGLAAQLGGALAIDSKPGVGTRIDLWLPTTGERVEGAPDVPTAPRKERAGTALLVDDEDLVRASTADMLADLGYAVVEANCAEDALRLVDNGLAFDLLVTDHLMPGLNGTDFVHKVRERYPATRALIISGYAEVQGVAPDLPRLVKPFRQADLMAKLGEMDLPDAVPLTPLA
jgi:PAS domain S-box-containing protein